MYCAPFTGFVTDFKIKVLNPASTRSTMTLQFKAIVFLAASLVFVWLSRASLRDLRAHGFYRFFAWEAILALILLNLDSWFREPFGIHQIGSWTLLIVSGYLVIRGVQSLHRMGKPDSRRIDPSLLGIEKTTELVTTGAYRSIRHPLYASLLFLAWGVFFKLPSAVGLGLAVLATVFLTATAKAEEVENTRYFGAAYREYMARTKRFIPFVF